MCRITACDANPVKVTGAGLVSAPPGAVWAMLRDPGVLARAIPGCQSVDVTGPGRRAVAVTTTIAAVAGMYAGEAAIRDRREPSLIAAAVSAAGARGSVEADVTVRLVPAEGGGTEVGYEIEARVDGAIAGVGQLVLAAIAKRLAEQFLAGLGAAAAAGAPAPAAGDQAGASMIRPDDELAPRAAAVRTSMLAGAAFGLAGIVIGAVLGRRGGLRAIGGSGVSPGPQSVRPGQNRAGRRGSG
jgi:uncharacterized protein